MGAQMRNAPTAGNSRGALYVQPSGANVNILLDRLEAVQAQGKGWRARCPSCGGRSRKLSVTEADNKVLVYCFAGCRGEEVIGAVGLSWADLFPPRTWPDSPEQRKAQRRAIREAGWASALSVLALESKIILYAARELHITGGLEIEDGKRLAEAIKRVEHAANVLTEARP